MLVFERMTHTPITISPDTPVADALQLLREKNVRRLPVLDKKSKLIGMVTEKDLLYASPSPATVPAVYSTSRPSSGRPPSRSPHTSPTTHMHTSLLSGS